MPTASNPAPTAIDTSIIVEEVLEKIKVNESTLEKAKEQKKPLDEISRQFEERLKTLEKERMSEVIVTESELTRLRAEISKTEDFAVKKELEARVARLEKDQEILMSEFNQRQQNLKEQQYIMRTRSSANFYRSLQNKLQQIFLGCKVVSSGIAAGDTFTAGEKVLQYVQLAGSSIPLPGADVVGYVAQAASYGLGMIQGNKVDRNASLTVSMREMDEVTETVARRLTFAFEEQLNFIPPESAWLLGECASKEIVAHLWTNNVDENSDTLVDQFVSVVVKIEAEEQSSSGKVKMMKEKMSTFFSRVKDLAVSAWEKINQPFNFNTDIPTSTGDKWTSDGIFHRSGIFVNKDGKEMILFCFGCLFEWSLFSLFPKLDKKFWYSGEPTRPEKYGYRKGSEEEVTKFGLKQTRDRVMTKVVEIAGSVGSKAMNKLIQYATDAAKGNKDEVELLRKQMQMQQAKMEALEKSLTAGGGASNATTHHHNAYSWRTVEVVAWFDREGLHSLSVMAKKQEWDGPMLFALFKEQSEGYKTICGDLGITRAVDQTKLRGRLGSLFDGQ